MYLTYNLDFEHFIFSMDNSLLKLNKTTVNKFEYTLRIYTMKSKSFVLLGRFGATLNISTFISRITVCRYFLHLVNLFNRHLINVQLIIVNFGIF